VAVSFGIEVAVRGLIRDAKVAWVTAVMMTLPVLETTLCRFAVIGKNPSYHVPETDRGRDIAPDGDIARENGVPPRPGARHRTAGE